MDYKKICKALIAEIRRLRDENTTLQEALEYSDAAMARLQESYERQYWEDASTASVRKVSVSGASMSSNS